MKKTLLVALAVLTLTLGHSLPGHAERGGGHGGGGGGYGGGGGGYRGGGEGWHGGGHDGGHDGGYGGGWGGGGFGVNFGPGSFFPPAWDQYPYPVYAPPVIVNQTDQYATPQPQEQQYRYYCRNPEGYYPNVQQCQVGWMKVVPTAPPSGPAGAQ